MSGIGRWIGAFALLQAVAVMPTQAKESVEEMRNNHELSLRHLLETTPDEARVRFLDRARAISKAPIVQRVYKLEDVGQKGRTSLDGRALNVPADVREMFALAMSDFSAAGVVRNEMTTLAAAYMLTGEHAFLDRLLAQLNEVATWSPIQRPGWTLFHAKARPSP